MTRPDDRDPTASLPISIPLGRARLCLDCEVIWRANGRTTCPSCGSHVYWSMGGRLLGRSPDEEGSEGEGT